MKKLSSTDRAILKAIENLVDGIAINCGKHTEVVLHSLDVDNPCVMKICNGHITGRQVGAPITNLALEKISKGEDISKPYFTKSPCGKNLRSTTTLIRNADNVVIGAFCLNMDLEAPFQEIISNFMPSIRTICHEKTIEEFYHNTDDMLKTTIENMHQLVMTDKKITAGKKTKVLVVRLFELGIFNFKSSPHLVAELTGISIHTVYRHLRKIEKN